MPATSICSASSLDPRFGAKPPSSPTAAAQAASCSVRLSAWNDLGPDPQRLENVGAPTGTTMNSWKSTELSAWTPPLRTFIIGTGSTRAASPPR
jgi:hypothetical protein